MVIVVSQVVAWKADFPRRNYAFGITVSPLIKPIKSAFKRSFSVMNKPCGAPLYTMYVAWGNKAAVLLPALTGTVLSSSPWIIKVGTVIFGTSPLKSVSENDRTHSVVALAELIRQ